MAALVLPASVSRVPGAQPGAAASTWSAMRSTGVQNTATSARRTAAFWKALGAQVRVMDPDEHDRSLALTSHLPHLAAAALAGILPAGLQALTATGFRDATRVAAGDPALWTAIFVQNRAAVLDALRQLDERLGRFRQALEAGDVAALDSLLTQAKQVRDALGS